MKTLIRNCKVISGNRMVSGGVLISGGQIAAIITTESAANTITDEIIDGAGHYLCPGYVDLHIHGAGGFSFDAGIEQFQAVCDLLPKFGVTSVLATLIPKLKGEDAKYAAKIASEGIKSGAEVLGLHLEGPFISLPGAVPPEHLRDADAKRARALKDAASPLRAVFSISPEFHHILELIPMMADGGVPVFMTHTRASVEQTVAAIEAGVTHATHFYNVFPHPPEREAGVRPCGAAEAVLESKRVSVDFILDGEHVDPIAVKLAMRCKGMDGVALVTDSNIGAGLSPGTEFDFGSYRIIHKYVGGPARICTAGPLKGALAGSGLTMDQAVRNAVRLLNVDLVSAVRMASTNPAQIAGYGNSKGRIQPGYDADLVLLDSELNVRHTWVRGKSVFKA